MGQALGPLPMGGAQRLFNLVANMGLPIHELLQEHAVKIRLAETVVQAGHGIQAIDRPGQYQSGHTLCRITGGADRVRAPIAADLGPPRRPTQQGAPQLVGVDRLGDEIVHASVEAALPVVAHRVGGHGDHRQGDPRRHGADRYRRRNAVEHGHLHVHQHQVKAAGAEQVERALTVFGRAHHHADILQHFRDDLPVDLVVFHQQHVRAVQWLQIDALVQRRGWPVGPCVLG